MVLFVKFDDVIHGDNGIAMQLHHGTNGMPDFQAVLWRTPIHLARKTDEAPLLELIMKYIAFIKQIKISIHTAPKFLMTPADF